MNPKEAFQPGIGATPKLDLRVSVATLVRVLFPHPDTSDWMLALERQATVHPTADRHSIEVKSQPFGGAIQIREPSSLRDAIGEFHFDSEHSQTEKDFRLFIRSSAWTAVRDFCLQHLNRDEDSILETDPVRELTEEFAEALKIGLKNEQYVYKPIGKVVEEEPSPTENMYASGVPTARIYRIFEAQITDPLLANIMIKSSESISDHDLGELARQNAQRGGAGTANTILVLPWTALLDAYQEIPPQKRNAPIWFEHHCLDETVVTVLEHIGAPKYQRL